MFTGGVLSPAKIEGHAGHEQIKTLAQATINLIS